MTKKKEYESKEYLIANYERIVAEMDAVHGPQIASPPRGRPRKGEVRTPMIGKTVKLPEAVWKSLQSQARKQHTTVNSMIAHRLSAA